MSALATALTGTVHILACVASLVLFRDYDPVLFGDALPYCIGALLAGAAMDAMRR